MYNSKTYKIKTSKLIGERIKEERRKKGLTQEALAELLGVTYQQVQRYENGSNKLNVEQIQWIATFLDTDIVSFFDDKGIYSAEQLSPYGNDKVYEKTVRDLKKIKTKKNKKLYLDIIKLIIKAEVDE